MYIASKVILKYAVSGVQYALAEFEVDTASNLPQSTGTTKISVGSKANVVDTGAVYKMGANDTWVLQEAGTAGYTKAEVDALIASLDATTVGGSGKYLTTIYETDGIIHASSATIQTSVNTSTNAVSSNAVKTYVDNSATTLSNSIAPAVFGMGQNTYIRDDVTGIDLDDYYTAGIYIKQYSANVDTFLHTPFKAPGDHYGYTVAPFKLIVEYVNSPNNIRQTLIPLYDSSGYFVRVRTSGVSGTWKSWIYYYGNKAFYEGYGISASSGNTFDLNDLTTLGRYNYGASAAPYIDSLPSDVPTNYGGQIIVEANQINTRYVQTIRVNGKPQIGKYWQRYFTYEGWQAWYRFDGTQVTTAQINLQSLGGDMRSSVNDEQEEEIIDDER